MTLPPSIKAEAEVEAKKRFNGSYSMLLRDGFDSGARWLFTRLMQLSEGAFDEKRAQGAACDHEAQPIVDDFVLGARYQHALNAAKMLALEAELNNKRGAMTLEIHRLSKELEAERAKCSRLEDALERIASGQLLGKLNQEVARLALAEGAK